MNDTPLREQLSAFADGELPRDEARLLVARLGRDGALRSEWQRHHLVSECLRGGLPARIDTGFAARVQAALASEPGHESAAVSRWARPLAGGAIAATVAFLAVMGIRGQLAPTGEVVPPLAASNPLGVVGAPSRVEFEPEDPELEARLNSYLLDHDAVTGGRIQGVAPYVRGAKPAAVKQESEPTRVAETPAADDEHTARPRAAMPQTAEPPNP